MMIPRGRGPYDAALEVWPEPDPVAPHEQTVTAAIAAMAQRGLGPGVCIRRRLTSISRLTTVKHSGARGRPTGKREEGRDEGRAMSLASRQAARDPRDDVGCADWCARR